MSTFKNLMTSTEVSIYGTRVRALLNAAMAPFAVWFWVKGIYLYKETPCGSFAFLFAKVDMFGAARIILIVVSVLVAILTTAIFMVGIIDVASSKVWKTLNWIELFGLHSIQKANAPTISTVTTWKGLFCTFLGVIYGQGHYEVGGHKWSELSRFRKGDIMSTLVTTFAVVWTILAMELTIIWNGITGVYVLNTTGQLIPFVIGLGGLLKTLYEIFSEWYRGSKLGVPRSERTKGDTGKEMKDEKKRVVFIPVKGRAVSFVENTPGRRLSF
ncbi:MAG: hypothetical protein M1824_006636 [Vezdaea acicularis]|nr:MAG: hypothetical protein M1824_006636 [Vezdaea acicularis]